MTEETGFLSRISVVKGGKLKPALLAITPEYIKIDYLSVKRNTKIVNLQHVLGARCDVGSAVRFTVGVFAETKVEQFTVETLLPEECSDWVQRIQQAVYPASHSFRRLAVLINPISGRKKGTKTFQKCLLPMLEFAEMSYVYYETESAGYIAHWCETMDLSYVSEIVLFGGDGLLNQLLNALAAAGRLDIPIGIIPCGSQNAMACAIGGKNPYAACLNVVKGKKVTADVMKLSLDGEVVLASSATAWGIVSDIAVEAQHMRTFGTAVRLT